MPGYDIELSFALPSPDADPGDFVDRLYEAGCGDATVGIGRSGHIGMLFTRDSDTAWDALASAIRDVRGAIPGARLEEAGPDLVGLTDLGLLLGVSRQNARKLIVGSRRQTPAPVHIGNPSVWHLADLLRWLREVKRYEVDDRLVEVADVTRQVNLAIESRAADRRAQREIRALLR